MQTITNDNVLDINLNTKKKSTTKSTQLFYIHSVQLLYAFVFISIISTAIMAVDPIISIDICDTQLQSNKRDDFGANSS